VLKSNVSSDIKACLIDECFWDALKAGETYRAGFLFYLYVREDRSVKDFKNAERFEKLLKEYDTRCKEIISADGKNFFTSSHFGVMEVVVKGLLAPEKNENGCPSLLGMAAHQAIVRLKEENPVRLRDPCEEGNHVRPRIL
jgi:hypothetical protein